METYHIFGVYDGPHEVGEVRLKNGLPSMCLGRRHYGGGIGYVWATQAEPAEFTVRAPLGGYLYGICQSVNAKRKSISVLIVRGFSWGDFSTGNIVQIPAESIDRYHRPLKISEETLVEWAHEIESTVYANEVFIDTSKTELEEVFKEKFKQDSILFLGEKAYEKSLAHFTAYKNFLENIRNAKGDFRRQPSKKLMSSARQVRETLGIEGTRIVMDDEHLFPANLSAQASSAYGAVCGALAGDAAGGVLESLERKPTRSDVDRALGMQGGGVFSLAPGQITDDGELTICLLRSLSAADGKYISENVARDYIDWARTKPFGIGQATSSALLVSDSETRGSAQSVFHAAATHNQESKSNGALMRISALGVAAAGLSKEDTAKFAMADARMTHPNPTCTFANVAYVLAIRHLILYPGDRHGAVDAAKHFLEKEETEVAKWLVDAISGDLPDALPQIGFVRIAFTYAFYHLHQGSSYRTAIADTLLRGGDTDTNACIVGGLVGAYRGINDLIKSEASRKLIYPVMMCDPSLGQHRPDVYHAATVPQLLRRLVEALKFDGY